MTRYRIGDVIRFTGHRIDARDPEPGAVGVCAPIAGARGSNSPHPDPFGSMVYAIWNDGSETSVWVRATEKLGKVKIPKLESFKGTHGQQMSAWVSAIREAAKLAARKFASWTAPAHSAPSAGHEPADVGDAACPQCGGEGTPLGGLGNLMHYRCRQCGWDFSRKATKRNPRGDDWSEGGTYTQVSKTQFEDASRRYGAPFGLSSVTVKRNVERLWAEYSMGGDKRQGIGFRISDFRKLDEGSRPKMTYWLLPQFVADGVHDNPRTPSFRVGDKVRWTGEYLRNTGQPTGPEGLTTWKVVGLGKIGSINVAHLEAGYGRNTEKRTANVENLEIDYRQNPSCRTCGWRVDGDGWDGECGNCADRSESSGKRPRTPRSRCRTCRGRVDGDGWNGECGNCADRSETARQNPPTPGTRQWQRRHGFGGTSPGAKALTAAVGRGEELISYVLVNGSSKGGATIKWMVGTGNTKTDLVVGSEESVPAVDAAEGMSLKQAAAVRAMLEAMRPIKYVDGPGDGLLYGILVWAGTPLVYAQMSRPETYRDHLMIAGVGSIPYTAAKSGEPRIVEKLVPINRGRKAPRWIK